MRPVLLFDIETVPDADIARKVLGAPESLGDDEALARLFPPKRDGDAFGFPKPLYHKVVEIAACTVGSSGEVSLLCALSSESHSSEPALLQNFWLLAGRNPAARIATFNGRRFDVPVLVQRALMHGVSPAPIFRGNYRARFQDGHIDLMEILSDYGASVPLSQNEAAVMLGVPGKLGVDGSDVATLYADGDTPAIAAYCTCDVATLTLCYARLGVHTGWCSAKEAEQIEDGLVESLDRLSKTTPSCPLYRKFLDAI